jgi:hypothetical protein
MLRPRGDDRVAIITAPLSMTVVIGPVVSAAEAEIIFGALTAPFDFAQGRLWKPCPSRSLLGRRRIRWRRVCIGPSSGVARVACDSASSG